MSQRSNQISKPTETTASSRSPDDDEVPADLSAVDSPGRSLLTSSESFDELCAVWVRGLWKLHAEEIYSLHHNSRTLNSRTRCVEHLSLNVTTISMNEQVIRNHRELSTREHCKGKKRLWTPGGFLLLLARFAGS
jgi:hypothetical protein